MEIAMTSKNYLKIESICLSTHSRGLRYKSEKTNDKTVMFGGNDRNSPN